MRAMSAFPGLRLGTSLSVFAVEDIEDIADGLKVDGTVGGDSECRRSTSLPLVRVSWTVGPVPGHSKENVRWQVSGRLRSMSRHR